MLSEISTANFEPRGEEVWIQFRFEKSGSKHDPFFDPFSSPFPVFVMFKFCSDS